MFVVVALVAGCCFLTFMSFFISLHTATIVPYGKWLLMLAVVIGSGPLFAWRWMLSIGSFFVLLVVCNELYAHRLATELVAFAW